MGGTGLFLYKGREGYLEKIDEINMEVWGLGFGVWGLGFWESILVLTRSCAQLHRSSIITDTRLNRISFSHAPSTSTSSAAPADLSAAAALSTISYVAPTLAAADAIGYRSAGIVLYDVQRCRGQHGDGSVSLRLFLGRNHEDKIEFLSGKREACDADVYATAAREFDEESGGVLGEGVEEGAHRAVLARACRSSRVLW